MKNSTKEEINEALDMILANDCHLEDCSDFVQSLSGKEAKQLARAVEKQFDRPCRKTEDGLDLKVQLKIALMEGFVPVL
jgi:hypothetical protein